MLLRVFAKINLLERSEKEWTVAIIRNFKKNYRFFCPREYSGNETKIQIETRKHKPEHF